MGGRAGEREEDAWKILGSLEKVQFCHVERIRDISYRSFIPNDKERFLDSARNDRAFHRAKVCAQEELFRI